ncbi:hypothetical protein MVEG_01379 [Podila verticillata NRRL 6337]|nr:hypothetical protein MVEG_01379 [Podila verticillata NRRL 6337]
MNPGRHVLSPLFSSLSSLHLHLIILTMFPVRIFFISSFFFYEQERRAWHYQGRRKVYIMLPHIIGTQKSWKVEQFEVHGPRIFLLSRFILSNISRSSSFVAHQ